MTGRFILADVTSHRRGFDVQPIIDAAARRAQTAQHHGKVLWLLPSHLTAAFNAAHGIGNNSEIRNCDIIGPPLWGLIHKEIESVSSTTSDIEITVVTKTADRTGVEMEALTAVAAAGLALIDMIKAVDPDASIERVRVLRKEGGKTGLWERSRD